MDVLRYVSRRILAAPIILSPGSTSDFSMLFLGHNINRVLKKQFPYCHRTENPLCPFSSNPKQSAK